MGTLLNRRRYMGGGSSPLPYDAEIEYLESNWNQYIDLGIIGTNSISYKLKAICTSIPRNYWIGAWVQGYGVNSFCVGKDNGDNKLFAAYGSGGTTNTSINYFSANNVVEIEQTDGKFYINGNLERTINPNKNFSTSPYSIYLFGQNRQGSFYAGGTCKICKCEFYDNGNLILDLIPVRVGQEGCLYDKVTKRLLHNAGTGDFILGSDKT